MTNYIFRRLLFMIPTLFGITLICFTLIQFVPGGPVEQYIARVQGANAERGLSTENSLNQEEIENIRAYFGFDEPAHIRYLNWITNITKCDLGTSYFHEEPVFDVIASKFPISLFFGLSSFFLSYLICIPLGVFKAMHAGKWLDTISSILIFIGYVIPSYALGVLLLILFGGGSYLDLFPMQGIVSDNFEDLTPFEQVLDFLHHMVLPMTCYMASQFAFLTLLMKNSIIEEIRKDYIRTALVKGSSRTGALFKHALRNSLIPLATGLSEIFTVMFAGSLLIEKVFDIDGMGLLFYNSIVNRDYNVVMGLILLMSIMTLLGRLFSDILYALVDPRIRFK